MNVQELLGLAGIRRLLLGSAKLLTGNVLGSAIGVVSFALAARALGTDAYGQLVLIAAGITMVDQMINFQSWQAVIKFGSDLWGKGPDPRLAGLLRVGFLLDSSTALCAFLLANAILWTAAPALELPHDVTVLATFYALSILFNVTGTPIAVLRMANRYTALAMQATAAAAVKLVAVVIAFTLGGGLAAFAFAWFISDILGYLLLFFLGFRVARLHGLLSVHPMGVRKVLQEHPGLVRFLIVANVQTSVRLGTTQLDTLIVGSALGAPAAGSYNVVKKLSKLISIVLSPLYYVVYPELALANSTNDRVTFNALVNKSAIVMTGLCALGWLAFLVVGPWFIDITVGPQYMEVYPPLLVYLVGVGLSLISFSYQPAMLALGRADSAFKILLAATIVYLAALPVLAQYLGLLGACASYILFYAIWGGLMHYNIRDAMSTWRPLSSQSEKIT